MLNAKRKQVSKENVKQKIKEAQAGCKAEEWLANCKLVTRTMNDKCDRVFLVALRDINPREELFYDYGVGFKFVE